MAKLEVATGRGIKLEKAYFMREDGKKLKSNGQTKAVVMFNPTELSVKKTVPWDGQPKPGEEVPKQQFTAGQAKTLSLKLDFDSSGFNRPPGEGPHEAMDIRSATAPIMELAHVPDDKTPAHPPLVIFQWGDGLSFTCVIKSVNVTYTKFNPAGWPIRANMQVEMLEAKPYDYTVFMGADVSSGKITTADDGSTAASLAGSTAAKQEDGWRNVANQSSSDNPRWVPAGESVKTQS